MTLSALLLLIALGSDGDLSTHAYIAFVSIPFRTNSSPLKAIAEELLSRGYRASLALPETEKDWVNGIPDLEFVSTGQPPPVTKTDIRGRYEHCADPYEGVVNGIGFYVKYQRAMYKKLLHHYSKDRPDLLVIDRTTFAGFDVAHSLNISYVVNNPMLLLDLDEPPNYIPAPYSGHPIENQTLWQRCRNIYLRLRFRLAMMAGLRKINEVRTKWGLPSVQHRADLYKDSLVISNSAFALEYSRPFSPLFQMVGPILQNPAPPRSTLLEWLESKEHEESGGTILVHFCEYSPLVSWQAQNLLEGLSTARTRGGELPRILWVLPQEQWGVLPTELPPTSRFRLTATVPQNGVLPHRRITMFVNGCGLNSAEESLLYGKPVLSAAFSPNQVEVALQIARLGGGLMLNMIEFTVEDVRELVQRLHLDSSFMQTASLIGSILEDAGGTKRAADLIAAVEELGTQHLVTPHSSGLAFRPRIEL